MKAILLAAGYGKRLGSLTKKIPKCLIKINNKPIIQIWIDKLYSLGVRDILVNTHYLSHDVKKFLLKLNYKNLKITISYEKKLLGTAGTVFKNISYLNDNCFLIHVDNYNNANLNYFIKAHLNRPKSCVMTMMVNYVDNCKNFGMITKNSKNILIDFNEKPKVSNSNLANSAIYILSPQFIKATINIKYKSDFSTEVIPYLLDKIYCFVTTKENIDIGIRENFNKINRLYLSK